jgi:16S rRNA (cytidine1402-2'-O)-methyltransferase
MDRRWTQSGHLYLVATPIGNLQDMPPRALAVLREADLILAEDTRVSGPWLRREGVVAPIVSHHQHSPPEQIQGLMAQLAEGKIVALVSDAGLPAVSDPGQAVVEAAWQAGIGISAVPGPSAGVTAFAVSGFSLPMVLWGFLPPRGGARSAAIGRLAECPATQVVYEAPGRVLDVMQRLADAVPERPLLVARELTKLHEELWRGPAARAPSHWAVAPPRGEFTLVLGQQSPQPTTVDWGALLGLVATHVERGLSDREAVRRVAEQAGVSRRGLYQRWHGHQTT